MQKLIVLGWLAAIAAVGCGSDAQTHEGADDSTIAGGKADEWAAGECDIEALQLQAQPALEAGYETTMMRSRDIHWGEPSSGMYCFGSVAEGTHYCVSTHSSTPRSKTVYSWMRLENAEKDTMFATCTTLVRAGRKPERSIYYVHVRGSVGGGQTWDVEDLTMTSDGRPAVAVVRYLPFHGAFHAEPEFATLPIDHNGTFRAPKSESFSRRFVIDENGILQLAPGEVPTTNNYEDIRRIIMPRDTPLTFETYDHVSAWRGCGLSPLSIVGPSAVSVRAVGKEIDTGFEPPRVVLLTAWEVLSTPTGREGNPMRCSTSRSASRRLYYTQGEWVYGGIRLVVSEDGELEPWDAGGGDAGLCTNTCRYAGDRECDDGGPGSAYAVCAFGSDCADCGTR